MRLVNLVSPPSLQKLVISPLQHESTKEHYHSPIITGVLLFAHHDDLATPTVQYSTVTEYYDPLLHLPRLSTTIVRVSY